MNRLFLFFSFAIVSKSLLIVLGTLPLHTPQKGDFSQKRPLHIKPVQDRKRSFTGSAYVFHTCRPSGDMRAFWLKNFVCEVKKARFFTFSHYVGLHSHDTWRNNGARQQCSSRARCASDQLRPESSDVRMRSISGSIEKDAL
jgi:hypothetical protein